MAATNQRKNSDHDSSNSEKNEKIVLDGSYIEYSIYNLFKIDVLNYVKVKAVLAKEFHIQPSEVDKLPAWEYELFMKALNELVKEENERNEKEMNDSGVNQAKKMSDPNNIRKMQQSSMRNMPNMGNFKMPNMSNFKIPSF